MDAEPEGFGVVLGDGVPDVWLVEVEWPVEVDKGVSPAGMDITPVSVWSSEESSGGMETENESVIVAGPGLPTMRLLVCPSPCINQHILEVPPTEPGVFDGTGRSVDTSIVWMVKTPSVV